MKKTTLFLTLTALMSSAFASERDVIKDTLVYLPYTAMLERKGGCSLAADPAHPKSGDCREVRGKMPVSGEYLVRNEEVCTAERYSLVHLDTVIPGRRIPSVHSGTRTYRCDARGRAL